MKLPDGRARNLLIVAGMMLWMLLVIAVEWKD